MSSWQLLHNSDDDIPYAGFVIYVAIVTAVSVIGSILVCCLCWISCKAAWQSGLDARADFTDCMLCYCNSSEVHCMLCMPRVRRGDSSLINCGCCFYDDSGPNFLCCIDWNTPLRKSHLTELGERLPITAHSASPNEVQAGPMSGVPLPSLSPAPPPTSAAETMPVTTGQTRTASSVTDHPGARHRSMFKAAGGVLLEIPVPSPSHALPPGWVDCGCFYVNNTTGACTCIEEPLAAAASGDDAAAGTHPHLHTTSDAAPKAST